MGREEGKLELRCINCGSGVRRLMVQYNPGNIRLMKCDNCKAVADPYIECEFMIVLIDLILHRQKAYRHLLYNVLSHDAVDATDKLWKSGFIYFVLDTCKTLLLNRGKEDWVSSSSSLVSIGTLVKVLMVIFLGNFVFLFFILLATRILLNAPLDINRYKGLLFGIFVSSYFKIFLIAMMVWEFPSSVIFIIDTFALSSNVVALKVLTQMPMTICIGVCLGANGAKFLANPLLLPPSSSSLGNK